MAGNFQNFEIGAEKISAGCFFDKEIRFRRFDFQCEAKISKKFAIGNHGRRERMTTDRAIEPALNAGKILNVIDMPVCQEQEFGTDIKRAQPFMCALRGVEEDPSIRRLNQIAIRFENSPAKALILHGDWLTDAGYN